MTASFYYVAVVKDEDLIRLRNGRKSMSKIGGYQYLYGYFTWKQLTLS